MKLLQAVVQCLQSPNNLACTHNSRTTACVHRNISSMFGNQFKDNSILVKSDIKQILHLNASHGKGSLVDEGARTFLANLTVPHSVTQLDLWAQDDLIRYTVNHARSKLNILKGSASQVDEELFTPVLTAAQAINLVDLVVVSTPMWNYSVPYVLKQYLDTVVQPGINFCDKSQASLENLRGRHLVVFSSAGAVYDDNTQLKDYLNPFLGQVFGLMGFDKQEFVFIQGTSSRSRKELELWTSKEAKRVAQVVEDRFEGALNKTTSVI